MLLYSALAILNAFKPRLSTTTEEGQGLVEYALILVLVALVAIVIVAALGDTISNGLYRGGVCVIANTFAGEGACG